MAIDKWTAGAAAAGVILLVGYCSTPRAEQQTGGLTTSASADLEDSISAKATTSGAVPDTVHKPTTIDKMPSVGGETYDEYATRRDALEGSAGSFEGDECTVDCGGHEAGREWAEQRGVTDEGECGGKSSPIFRAWTRVSCGTSGQPGYRVSPASSPWMRTCRKAT